MKKILVSGLNDRGNIWRQSTTENGYLLNVYYQDSKKKIRKITLTLATDDDSLVISDKRGHGFSLVGEVTEKLSIKG